MTAEQKTEFAKTLNRVLNQAMVVARWKAFQREAAEKQIPIILRIEMPVHLQNQIGK